MPERLETCLALKDFFLSSIQALLWFIRDVALDIKEFNGDVFKQQLADLEAQFAKTPKLSKTAAAFRKHRKRIQRFIARYGGEEFVIVLSNASLPNAVKKAKLICRSIGDMRWAIDDGKTGQILSLTISIGIGVYQTGDTRQAVIQRADQALYVAKNSGKNRVVAENEWVAHGAMKPT
ncbi:MAG: GGDEF domain-containing protein [Desulfobacterales bacterium]|nr:GGDEF domain-containing protein [Desulfobacterales bacterium]